MDHGAVKSEEAAGPARTPRMPMSIPIVIEPGEPLTVELMDAGARRFYVTPVSFRPARTAAVVAAAVAWTSWAARTKRGRRRGEAAPRSRPAPRSRTKDERYDRAERDAAAAAEAAHAGPPPYWPFAPVVQLHADNPRDRRGRRRLVLSWDLNKTLKPLVGRLRAYELFVAATPRRDGVPCRLPWRRACAVAAGGAMPAGCLIDRLPDGHTYRFGVRAVDARGRHTMFNTCDADV